MTSPEIKKSLLAKAKLPLIIYCVCLAAYLGTAGGRLKGPSSDNHFVHLADNILHGRLSLKGNPPHQNDWARVVEITLKDGRKVRGSFRKTTGGPHRFRTTRGEKMVIPPENIRQRKDVYYVSFPWFPAIAMLPFVAIWGMKFNDVIFTVAWGAFNPVLVFFVLRRLSALKYSQRSVRDDLWLVLLFALGSVHYSSAVMGQVWYTAHIVGVGLTCLYVLAALEGRHPFLAGLCLGLGFVTRTPIPFSFPLVVGEIFRRHLRAADVTLGPALVADWWWPQLRQAWQRIEWKPVIRDGFILAVPVFAIAGLAFTFNYMRFDSPTEFGHNYLNVLWAERIQKWGLFNYHFLSRNLAVLLTLLPRISAKSPYMRIHWHGLGLFFTTPLFLYVLWPKKKTPLHPWLHLSILFPMILHLFYQNSGWVQFGYRFSLDYTIFLVMLLALGGRKMGKWAKTLIIFGVAVNTFGAITFNRYRSFYWNEGQYFFPDN